MAKDDDGTIDRAAILRRRNRLIALALSGAAIGATACEPTPCLEPVILDGGAADAEPRLDACLSPPPPDAGEADAEPVPCLTPLPPDAGDLEDAG